MALQLKDKYSFNELNSNDVTGIGMGYVGLTLACVLAEKNFNVIGFDKNLNLIKKLNNKKTDIYEMGLQSHLEASLNINLKFKTKQTNDSSVYIISIRYFYK